MLLIAYSILLLNAMVESTLETSQETFRSDPNEESPGWGDFDSSSPHIFSSLRYLLRQWPNTIYPNGHSIVPCEVPAFSRFYHGRTDDLLPASPEWLAFDIEMAYGIMGSTQTSHMLTYQVMHPVKCVYFDGMSAALLNMSQLQSQSVFLYGNTTGPSRIDEYRRAQDLCKWMTEHGLGGLGWGIEGIVRMNAGFEMIWCNFSSPSIKLIHHITVAAPQLRHNRPDNASRFEDMDIQAQQNTQIPLTSTAAATPQDHATKPAFPPPLWPDLEQARQQEPYFDSQAWEWFRSATRKYGQLEKGNGENRLRLITCGFVTFYDHEFDFHGGLPSEATFESAVLNEIPNDLWGNVGWSRNHNETIRAISSRRRWHNLEQLEERGGKLVREKVKNVLQAFVFDGNTAGWSRCTGANWPSITNDIAEHFSKPLLKLAQVASLCGSGGCSDDAALESPLRSTRSIVHAMLLPFFEYPHAAFSVPLSDREYNKTCWTGKQLALSTHARCKSYYTRFTMNDGKSVDDLTAEEKLIITSIEDVMSSICGTLISVLFFAERIWLTYFNSPATAAKGISSGTRNRIAFEMGAVAHRLKVLWAWLGWEPDRIECERRCELDEECYIPMWPLRLLDGRIVHDPTTAYQSEELWDPRCVKMELGPGVGMR